MTAAPEQLTVALGDRYRIRRELGQGGMAVVYLADDLKHDRSVAIKVLRPDIGRALGADRFLHEIRTTAGLAHPHILPLHDSGDADGLLYYVMPFVEGESLRQRIDRQGRLPLGDALRIAREVGGALEYAHQRHVIHRDIKPENILLGSGHAFVADFGIARALRSTGDQRLTRPGTSLGTPAYMSPEQAYGEDSVDARSDEYSLACMLYEMVAGRTPWTGPTAEAVLVKRFTSPAPRLQDTMPEVPGTLDDALQTALAREPEGRFSSVAEFLAVLDVLTPAAPAVPRTPARPASLRHTVGRESARAQLRAAFDETLSGRGLLLCVTGEPGMGKTTLVEEFLAELGAEGAARLARGRCSERLAGTEAYLPHLEALDSVLRNGGADVARTMRELAPTWYAQVAVQADSGERAVLQREVESSTPERMKRELSGFLEAMARVTPLVIFFEDLHWADVSTIDLLGFIAARFSTTPVLIVVTYRPSDMLLSKHPFLQINPDLVSRGVSRELPLEFLNREDIAAYLALEFPGHAFPAEFPALLLARTEGSPLFMADLVRYLKDRGVIRPVTPMPGGGAQWMLAEAMPDIERALPESVRGMIDRKIAQLSESDRALLIAASVQGNDFDSAVMARALELEAVDVEARLEALERVHGLVRLVEERELPDRVPSLRYRFVHVLYQNALYATLRATRRTQLHRAVAAALEALAGAQAVDEAPELAMLWEGAREPAKAANHLLHAAQRAFRVHANRESAALAARGIGLLETLPETRERDRQELALQVTAGAALRLSRGYGDTAVGKAYRRACVLAERSRDDSHLFITLHGLWEFHELRAEYPVALDFARQLFTFADRRRDPALLVIAHETLGDTNLWMGDLRVARRHLERGAALYDRERSESEGGLYGYDSGVASLSFLALVLWYLGYPDQAQRRAAEALEQARGLRRPAGVAQTMFFSAWVLQLRGDVEEAMAQAEELIALSDEHDLPMYQAAGRLLKGVLLAGLGRGTEGVPLMREGIAGHQASGTVLGSSVWSGGWLAEGLLTIGAVSEAAEGLRAALAAVEQTGERFHAPELWRLRAKAATQPAEAAAALDQAIQAARGIDAKSLELRAAMDRARAGQGKSDLEQVYRWFTEGFDTADLREARALLAVQP